LNNLKKAEQRKKEGQCFFALKDCGFDEVRRKFSKGCFALAFAWYKVAEKRAKQDVFVFFSW